MLAGCALSVYLASSHLMLIGVERPQAMESVMPEDICAQALSDAVRSAPSLSAPDAERQAFRPSYAMQTSTRYAVKPLAE